MRNSRFSFITLKRDRADIISEAKELPGEKDFDAFWVSVILGTSSPS